MGPHLPLLRGRRGASAMEFALVSIVLAPLVLMTLDYSWYLFKLNALNQCVRDAVRAGADVCDNTNCDADIGGECTFCLSPSGADPETTAETRFNACWADAGLGGTATIVTNDVSGSLGDHERHLTFEVSVAHTSFTSFAVPSTMRARLVFMTDDQSFN